MKDRRNMAKLWGGRFKARTNPAFEYFSSSISCDYKLAEYDIRASRAHARMLKKIRILSATELRAILKGLDTIEKTLGKFAQGFVSRKYEDIHSFIESELVRIAGPSAKKIHTARSRNDQVNQAVRMYCKDAAFNVIRHLSALQLSILRQARRNEHVAIAGYTHLQKAQPILVSHQFLSYIEALERSKNQIEDCLGRIDVLTLGSGALAGSTIAIDREAVRKELGFASVSGNSLDSVGSRDFMSELAFALAQLGVTLSRVAEDFLIGQIEELSWYEIPEELCTGSSMMPQKRNPDFLELARGASAILIGNSTALLALQKGLPGSYNRDLQWDKEPLFASVEITTQILHLFRVFFDGLKVNAANAKKSLQSDSLCATDVAELLVQKGVAFRVAHETVGQFVLACAERKMALRAAPPTTLESFFGKNAAAVRGLLDPEASVRHKKSVGSTSPAEVRKQINRWERALSNASIQI